MRIRDAQKEAHQIAVDAGWWGGERNIGELLMLMVTELGEAMEAYRESDGLPRSLRGIYYDRSYDPPKPDGFAVELADTVIRIFDTAEVLGIDLERAIREKMDYNRTRPTRHGGKLA